MKIFTILKKTVFIQIRALDHHLLNKHGSFVKVLGANSLCQVGTHALLLYRPAAWLQGFKAGTCQG